MWKPIELKTKIYKLNEIDQKVLSKDLKSVIRIWPFVYFLCVTYLSYLWTHFALVFPSTTSTTPSISMVASVMFGVDGLGYNQAAVLALAGLAKPGWWGWGGRGVAPVAVQPWHVLAVKAAILQTCNNIKKSCKFSWTFIEVRMSPMVMKDFFWGF